MKRGLCGVVVLAVIVFFGAAVYAATLEDAKALGIKAATYVKEHGKEKGIAEVGNAKGQFVKGEMYVTLQDYTGHPLLIHEPWFGLVRSYGPETEWQVFHQGVHRYS